MEFRVEATEHILAESYEVLKAFKSNPTITIRYLEAVAGIRFAMMEAAVLLHSWFGEQETLIHTQQQQQLFQLMQTTENICSDPVINTTNFSEGDAVGPAIYLLKLLVRRFGFTCLQKISIEQRWIIPEGLRQADQVSLCS